MNTNFDRYKSDMCVINDAINLFNEFLNPARRRVPIFDLTAMMRDKNCIEVIHGGDWNALVFPNSNSKGVYFVFGHENSALEKNGLYVGKASYSSAIGYRLDKHFRPYKSQSHFIMNGYDNESYVLDYMASINLDCCELSFMASALEEFLIFNLKAKLNLLNRIGRKKGQHLSVSSLESKPNVKN